MSAKDLLLNFLYLAFLVVIVGGAIIFFIQGDRFAGFASFMRAAWPILFLLIALVFKLRLTQQEATRADATGVAGQAIPVTFNDKMKGEVVSFVAPLAVLIPAAFSEASVTTTNLIQAFLVFLVVFAWNKYLWLRAR